MAACAAEEAARLEVHRRQQAEATERQRSEAARAAALQQLKRVIEEALTLRRPCCRKPIVQGVWDACASVACNCGACFCSVCLGFSVPQGNVHEHLRQCSYNPLRG